MALHAHDRQKVLVAATLRTGIPSTGLNENMEAVKFYNEVVAELEDAPEGVMVQPVFDVPDEKYDELIENSDKRFPKPTLEERKRRLSMTLEQRITELKQYAEETE